MERGEWIAQRDHIRKVRHVFCLCRCLFLSLFCLYLAYSVSAALFLFLLSLTHTRVSQVKEDMDAQMESLERYVSVVSSIILFSFARTAGGGAGSTT